MCPRVVYSAALIISLLLLAACGPSSEQRTARLLDDRLQTQLGPDLKAGSVALQPLANGARVTLVTTALFPNDVNALSGEYPDIRSSVIEALLDPSLMHIQVGDTAALPSVQQDMRIRNVNMYFVDNGLAPSLLPAAPAEQASGGLAPAGLTITISVHCPHRDDGTGYGSGKAKPACN